MVLPGRMLGRDVEGVEVVPVALDLRPLGDREAEVGEDRGDLVGHLADGWMRACGGRPGASVTSAHSPATRASSAASASRARAAARAAVSSSFRALSAGPAVWRSSGRHGAEAAHQRRDLALLAEGGEAHLFEPRLVGGGGDGGQVLLAQAGDAVHVRRPCREAGQTPITGARDCKRLRHGGRLLGSQWRTTPSPTFVSRSRAQVAPASVPPRGACRRWASAASNSAAELRFG